MGGGGGFRSKDPQCEGQENILEQHIPHAVLQGFHWHFQWVENLFSQARKTLWPNLYKKRFSKWSTQAGKSCSQLVNFPSVQPLSFSLNIAKVFMRICFIVLVVVHFARTKDISYVSNSKHHYRNYWAVSVSKCLAQCWGFTHEPFVRAKLQWRHFFLMDCNWKHDLAVSHTLYVVKYPFIISIFNNYLLINNIYLLQYQSLSQDSCKNESIRYLLMRHL